MRFVQALTLASVALALGCRSAPAAPPAAPLEIAPMPAAPVEPLPPPPPAASARAAGKCGQETKVGDLAPPARTLPIRPDSVTVLFFWATWCAPCTKQFPKYQDIHARFHARGATVLGLSVDDEDDGVFRFAQQMQITFPVGWDKDHTDASCWHPANMPTTYVVDRSGIVRFVHRGYHDGDGDLVAQEVESLL